MLSEAAIQAHMERLQNEEEMLTGHLPDYVKKLILGYELRTYDFELFECLRKLALVCLPVFFQPSGSVSQLMFGLIICFLTFGTYMVKAPYISDNDDRLASLCQAQIFFSLLSSVALKYDPETRANATNLDLLLSFLTFLPIAFAVVTETPLLEWAQHNKRLGSAIAACVRKVCHRRAEPLIRGGVGVAMADRGSQGMVQDTEHI